MPWISTAVALQAARIAFQVFWDAAGLLHALQVPAFSLLSELSGQSEGLMSSDKVNRASNP